ncbi:MAG: hypothetical protein KAX49_12195 [Halanaerobiales bacterium]|nr:hypothetical protein [Halanaerobiales bacterium]
MLESFWKFLFKPNEENGKNKRKNILMYLSFLVMLGVLLFMVDNALKTSDVSSYQDISNSQDVVESFGANVTPLSYEERIEDRLKKVLTLIEGVGKVEVDITIEQSVEYIYGINFSNSFSETEEQDNAGGIRVIKDTSESKDIVVIRGNNGEERALIQTEKSPIIKGVLVVAEGAKDPLVSANLSRAVNTVLGVPLHKICVLPYKR